jgi:GntR family transcriptional regulator
MVLHVNTASRVPIYQQLVRQVREAIARGEFRSDERLPSVRQLADELAVNPNTVAKAYTELERDGTLVSRPGLGMFVAQPGTDLTKSARDRRLRELLDQWLTEAVHLGYSAEAVVKLVTQRVDGFRWNDDDE